MMDILFALTTFIGISLIILAVVFVIPKLVILSTESEGNPDHIYTIFKEESGYRGHKILAAIGCFSLFIELAKSSNDIVGITFVTVMTIGCFIYHSSVYKGYPVFNGHMKIALASLLGFLTVVSILTRVQVLSGGTFTFWFMLSGMFWGVYTVYRRSVLIRIDTMTPAER